MSSKKGIVATIGILGLITVASSVIWILPQGNFDTQIIVTDYSQHIRDIDTQRGAMVDGVTTQFSKVLDSSVDPQNHIDSSRELSVIIKRQIAELLKSGATEPWYDSYGMYVESLRHLDEHIGETVVVSKLIQSGRDPGSLEKLNAALAESDRLAAGSIASLP